MYLTCPKADFKSKIRTADIKRRDFIARDKRICNARAELIDIGDLIFLGTRKQYRVSLVSN